MAETIGGLSPFSISNVRRFIAFRLFFNARFYYPVFTILFLDLGLTLAQFAILNTAWALTIVALEVPSGALADSIGRRRLLILSGCLMTVEMSLLAFAPRGNPDLLFAALLANRIFSGAAEAAASGADEALAYDSLKDAGLSDCWSRVLEVQMRIQSLGYVVVMILGAAVYDPVLVGRVIRVIGWQGEITSGDTLRLPVYLTLIMAVATLGVTLRMEEARRGTSTGCGISEACRSSFSEAFHMTVRAGKWILWTPFALFAILTGLLFDHVIRMVVTLSSQYYRLIGFPEATFGLIGSGLALLGVFVPRLARELVKWKSARFNALLMFGITLVALHGMALAVPWLGLLPVVLLFCVMIMMNFFVSHYLNEITESHQRATVLSFKGLSYNLAYGGIGILYSLLVSALGRAGGDAMPGAVPGSQDLAFVQSLMWFPYYFMAGFAALALFARKWTGRERDRREASRPRD
ncbi:MAG: MFS transporter [Syntrophobacteraceae bacterium]|jgi:MFS family permease|nr:MFS transporter [Syntrophobacteraceae bacterium]